MSYKGYEGDGRNDGLKIGVMVLAVTGMIYCAGRVIEFIDNALENRDQEAVIQKLPKEQRAAAEKLFRSGLSVKQIEKSSKELDEARTGLEKAKQALSRGEKQSALDWLITARGHIQNVDKNAFDVREIIVDLADIQKKRFSK